jgi:hypothetical protein
MVKELVSPRAASTDTLLRIFRPPALISYEQPPRTRIEFDDIQGALIRDAVMPAELVDMFQLDGMTWQKAQTGSGKQHVYLGFDDHELLDSHPKGATANIIIDESPILTRRNRKQYVKTLSVTGIARVPGAEKPTPFFTESKDAHEKRVIGLTYALRAPYNLQSGIVSIGMTEAMYLQDAAGSLGDPRFEFWLQNLLREPSVADENQIIPTQAMTNSSHDVTGISFALGENGFHLGTTEPFIQSTANRLRVAEVLNIRFPIDTEANTVRMICGPTVLTEGTNPFPLVVTVPATLERAPMLPTSLSK